MAPSQPDLFAAAAEASATLAQLQREHLERALVAIALELARKAGPAGVTVADIRITAEQRGLLTGHEHGRQLSWLNRIPKAAGLERTGELRSSTRKKAHGNLQRVYVLPEQADEARVA